MRTLLLAGALTAAAFAAGAESAHLSLTQVQATLIKAGLVPGGVIQVDGRYYDIRSVAVSGRNGSFTVTFSTSPK